MAQHKPAKSICPITNSEVAREEAERLAESVRATLPAGLARPALRALAKAGITKLEHFARFQETEVRQLHGLGAKGMDVILHAMQAKGIFFKTPRK